MLTVPNVARTGFLIRISILEMHYGITYSPADTVMYALSMCTMYALVTTAWWLCSTYWHWQRQQLQQQIRQWLVQHWQR